MGEEFQAGICGSGNWWNPPRSVFSAASSPCSMGLSHDVAGFGWPNNNTMVDETTKAKSNNSSGDDTNNSVCESPPDNNNNNNNIIINAFQEVLQKPQHSHQVTDPITSGNLLIDSTLQMMGFDLIPSDLAQPNNNLVRSNNGRSEMYSILQHDHHGNYRQDHQFQPSLSSGFSGSGSFGYNPTTLLQSLFDDETQQQQQQQQSYSDYSLNYGSSNNNNNVTTTTTTTTKHMSQPGCGLHFSNNTPYWNATDAMNVSDENNNNLQQRLCNNNFSSVPQLQQQYVAPTFDHKPKRINNNNNNTVNLTPSKSNMVCNEDQGHQDSRSTCVVKKTSSGNEQPVIKRARIETPSPLPTFKVRKEKLGDRITALQQLVSPFGKTDTASVLNEAIEYIKFLHDQVSVLSTPYMKNGGPIAQLNQQGSHKLKNNQETQKQDLKSRGLCLVPISSTFPVANETTADFWTPTFGGSFR